MEKEKWWFTFGVDHPVRSKCYVVIEGCYSDARGSMIRRYSNQWSHQYDSAEAAGVEKYGLREIGNRGGMYELLKLVHRIPLHPAAVEMFLSAASGLVLTDEIAIDDWTYVARLIMFRIEKQRKEKVNGTC